MNLPTLILTPLLALVLLAATLAVVRLVRGWRESRTETAPELGEGDAVALAERRDRLLTMLNDLELEHAMGKLSPQDYNDLKQFYEREALAAMTQLEAR